jgi:hypothetical protein
MTAFSHLFKMVYLLFANKECSIFVSYFRKLSPSVIIASNGKMIDE